MVREAVRAGAALELLVLSQGTRFAAPAPETVELSRGLFRQIAQTRTPQGVLAVAHVQPCPIAESLAAAKNAGWPLIVLDGIQDPGNVGGIIRTAAAAGAPALAVLPGTADPYGPKAVRASAGNLFRIRVAAARWADLEGLDGLGADARGEPLEAVDLERAGILVFGGEGRGLSREGLRRVAIPMAGEVESLNVAAAAAVLIYEVRRLKAR